MSWFRRTPHQRTIQKVLPVRNSNLTKQNMNDTKDKVGVSKTNSAGTDDKDTKTKR